MLHVSPLGVKKVSLGLGGALALFLGAPCPRSAHAQSPVTCVARQLTSKTEPNALNAAQSSRDSALSWLRRLNPFLDGKALSAKIVDAEDSLMFFRSFVPNFYDALKTSPLKINALAPLLRHAGWMLGDVHPGNFGAILLEDGSPVFTMNDLDDGGHGPLALDLLRFLSASRLADSTLDPAEIVRAYGRGLGGAPADECDYVSRLLKKAKKDGQRAPSAYFQSGSHELVRSVGVTRNVKGTVRKRFEKVLETLFPGQFELHDVVEVTRSKGGSGGLHRYRVLLKSRHRPNAERSWVVLEFKEMTESGMSAFALPAPPSPSERVKQGLAYTVGKAHSNLFRFAEVQGVPMTVRPRFEGNLNIDVPQVHRSDFTSLILREAWKLGEIHSVSADDPASYLRAIQRFPLDTWREVSEDIAAG